MNAYVFDHTALAALGAGNRLLSQLVNAAHTNPDRHIYVPALCLVAAVAERSGLDNHIGALPAIEVVELEFSAATAAGALIGSGTDWRAVHAVHVGRPTVDWPNGRPVVTAVPETYAMHGVTTVPLSPEAT
jgi:hypothetical protein